MKDVIYIDVLVFLNIIITFLLLLSSSRLMKISPPPGRFLIGSLIGGASSLIILAPDMGFFLSVLTKLIFSLVIVTAVYNPKSIKAIFRETGYFFAANFIFAGVMMFISSLPKINIVNYNNGAVYINFSFFSLIAASVFCYGIICILNRLTKHKSCASFCNIVIEFEGKTVSGQAIIDTGNALQDPFSGEGVIVADIFFLEGIIPQNVRMYLNGNENECGGIRLIPCSTVSGGGLLPVFKADRVKIIGDDYICNLKKVNIAVSKTKMTSAIIPAELTANSERRKENVNTAK